jgi:hypothetical protein
LLLAYEALEGGRLHESAEIRPALKLVGLFARERAQNALYGDSREVNRVDEMGPRVHRVRGADALARPLDVVLT